MLELRLAKLSPDSPPQAGHAQVHEQHLTVVGLKVPQHPEHAGRLAAAQPAGVANVVGPWLGDGGSVLLLPPRLFLLILVLILLNLVLILLILVHLFPLILLHAHALGLGEGDGGRRNGRRGGVRAGGAGTHEGPPAGRPPPFLPARPRPAVLRMEAVLVGLHRVAAVAPVGKTDRLGKGCQKLELTTFLVIIFGLLVATNAPW